MSSAAFIRLAALAFGITLLAVFAFDYFRAPVESPIVSEPLAEREDRPDRSPQQETEPIEEEADRSTIARPPATEDVPGEGAAARSADPAPATVTENVAADPVPPSSANADRKNTDQPASHQPERRTGSSSSANRTASGQVSSPGSAAAPSNTGGAPARQREQSGGTFTSFPAQAQLNPRDPSAVDPAEEGLTAARDEPEPAAVPGEPDPGSSTGGTKKPAGDNNNNNEPEPASSAVVRMVPSASELSVGEQLSITVEIAAGNDVGHVPFHVRFNPAVLQFEVGEQGPYLGSDGIQTAFFASATSSADTVVVGLSRYGSVPGVHGGGMLCTLHFTAVGPGEAGLAFARSHVRDSQNLIVPAAFQPAGVVVR